MNMKLCSILIHPYVKKKSLQSRTLIPGCTLSGSLDFGSQISAQHSMAQSYLDTVERVVAGAVTHVTKVFTFVSSLNHWADRSPKVERDIPEMLSATSFQVTKKTPSLNRQIPRPMISLIQGRNHVHCNCNVQHQTHYRIHSTQSSHPLFLRIPRSRSLHRPLHHLCSFQPYRERRI